MDVNFLACHCCQRAEPRFESLTSLPMSSICLYSMITGLSIICLLCVSDLYVTAAYDVYLCDVPMYVTEYFPIPVQWLCSVFIEQHRKHGMENKQGIHYWNS